MATKSISELKDSEKTWKKAAEALFFLVVLAAVFSAIFFGGNAISGLLESGANSYVLPIFTFVGAAIPVPFAQTISKGLYSGIVLGLGLVVSYLVFFHFLMALLEESNFIARVSHDADFLFRKIGLSGRATIPLLLGFGCTVPAVLGARTAKNDNERIAIGFLSLFLPCAARTSVILALVGAFLGPLMALAVYLIDALLVLAIGLGVNRVLSLKPGKPVFAKPPYKIPNLRIAAYKAYYETLEFVQISLPWLVAGAVLVEVLGTTGLLDAIGGLAKPLLASLFGLPPITFIPLVFGIVRGELAIAMLAAVGKTADFSLLLTPRQMIIFAVISMIYVPCLSTLAALIKEFGKRNAAIIVAVNAAITLAVGVGLNLLLSLFLA